MKRSRSLGWVFVTLGVSALALASFVYPMAQTSTEPGGIQAAWGRARQSGFYRFSADILQTTTPLPTVANVGRQSRQDTVRMEGRTDLRAQSLNFILWSQGGSVLNAQSGIEVKVESDRAFIRQGVGEWKEANNFSGLFAPNGDFMAYLSAVRDVVEHGTETRNGVTFARYTFRIDGRAYATYLRNQLERRLTETGELPPGVSLDVPGQYAKMTGQGELWVDENGLPMRQILHLDFPEMKDDQVKAEVTVDFSDFAKPVGGPPTVAGVLQSAMSGLRSVVVILAALAFVVAVIAYRRSKKFYAAVVVAVTASMVLTPLLQGVQAAQFSERMTARQQEQDQRTQESEALLKYQENMQENKPSTPSGPAALAMIRNDNGQDSDHDGRTDVQELFMGTDPNKDDYGATQLDWMPAPSQQDTSVDSDGDGLTDYEEQMLGTNPHEADSDGDLITDTLEVQGFSYAGRTWYTDPLEMDTNGDGVSDGREWNIPGSTHATWDTDGDGLPDLFDRDDDNDGVPDDQDLSPRQFITTTFDQANPFSLIVNDLTPGKYTYVELQLRPVITKHLWYAYNVLDWPQGDQQGQIQDADGKTLYDLDNSLDPSPANNGDIKLIPMLEIIISGSPDNLPPTRMLQSQYGIFVQSLPGSDKKAIYVPLQLVTDNRGGARTAFYAKMVYLPTSSWGAAHQVRMTWAVQALVDVCDQYTDGVCSHYSKYNEPQMVHVYPDAWQLTGLSVREDHGSDSAVIYEDPLVDNNLNDDDVLQFLTYGLDRTFLAARTDVSGHRDITVTELYRLFNHTTNAGVSLEERWGITNTLAVTMATYTHLDEALATLAMTTTKKVLEVFTPYWNTSPITPTLLFAREDHYRTTNLEGLGYTNEVVWNASQRQLTMDLGADGGLPVQTLASEKWVPYSYNGTQWGPCPIETYFSELERRYAHAFDSTSNSARESQGKFFYFQFYYLALYTGLSGVMEIAGQPVQTDVEAAKLNSNAQITMDIIGNIGNPGLVTPALVTIVDGIANKTAGAAKLFEYLGDLAGGLKNTTIDDLNPGIFASIQRLFKGNTPAKLTGCEIGAGVAALTGVIAFVVGGALYVAGAVTGISGLKIAGGILVAVAMIALQVVMPLISVGRLISAAMAAGKSFLQAAKGVLTASSAVTGATKAAGVVGLVISVGIIIGFFIYQVAQGGMNAAQICMLIALAIAQIIIAIIQFVVSMTVVGAIIVAIFAIVDLILSLFGDFTISGWIAEQIGKLLYHYELMVDPGVDIANMDMKPVHPALGMASNNFLAVTATITNTVTHKDPEDIRIIPYLPILYTERFLRSTSIQNELSVISHSISASRYEMKDTWNVRYDHSYLSHSMYQGTAMAVRAASNVTLTAGINVTVPLFLNNAFAIPGVSCWTLYIPIPIIPFYLPIPICYEDEMTLSNSQDLGSSMFFDVFPPTLDEFYNLKWDKGFGPQKDHDSDTLISVAWGGNDPNDENWDTDGDGLSDAYEVALRARASANGSGRPSPLSKDTDGDGVCDDQEIRWGTYPNRRDSDGDDLNDGDEKFHWNCMSGQWEGGWAFVVKSVITGTGGITTTRIITTHVDADPLMVDTDGDGLDDLAERTLKTNPQVWTPSPLALYTEVGDPDRFVAPGQTFAYTATVENRIEHDPGLFVLGGLTVTAPSALGGGLYTSTYNIYQGESSSLPVTLTVNGGAGTGPVAIRNQTVGRMHDGDLNTYYKWSPPPATTSASAAGSAYARIAAPAQPTIPTFAVASVEGAAKARLYHADGAFSAPLDERGDTRCGPGLGQFAPGVACANDGRCLTAWNNVHYHNAQNALGFDRFICKFQCDNPFFSCDATSEFYIKVNGNQIWYMEGVDSNTDTTMNTSTPFDNQANVEIWESDSSSSDDFVGSQSYGYCDVGTSWKLYTDCDCPVWPTDPWDPNVRNCTCYSGDDDGFIWLHANVTSPSWDGIYGAIANGSRVLQGSQFNISAQGPAGQYRRNPAAGSDGTNFLVAWQEYFLEAASTWKWGIVTSRVDNLGTVGANVRLDVPGVSTDDANPAVAWNGSNYLVVWESNAGSNADILMAFVNASGQLVSRMTVAGTTLNEQFPQVAYNPSTGQALIVYIVNGLSVRGRFVDAAGNVSREFEIGQRGTDWSIGKPSVAYEPTYHGWMVGWNASTLGGTVVRYVPLSSNGTRLRVKEGLGPQAPRYDLTAAVSPGTGSHNVACSSNATDYALCDGIASAGSTLYLTQLFMEDISPWLGTLEVITDTMVTVDADVPTATLVSFTNGQYLAITGTFIFGGDASDATSGVAYVQVRVDGGAWITATGAESWAYGWDAGSLLDGSHTITVHAVDRVGNLGPDTSITVVLDRTSPNVGFGIPSNTIVGATRNAAGQWLVALNGTVDDDAGSGAQKVETLLSPNGGGWQTATLAAGNWAITYVLPAFGGGGVPLNNPTGVYTAYARATDRLNNQSSPAQLAFGVDTTPPVADLRYTGPSTTTITQTLTLRGVVTDPGSVAAGVQQLEFALTPAGQDPTAWTDAALAQSGEGVITSTWSYPVPAGLEGYYQINLRGTDTRSNRNDNQNTWNKWRGEIDTLAPRVALTMTFRGTGSAAQTVYEGWAEDMNLMTNGFLFVCPLEAADRHYYNDTWWNQTTTNTQRLFQLTPACIVNGYQEITPTLTACDRYGRCTVVTGTIPGHTPPVASTVLTPSHESVLTATGPVSVTVGAYALNSLSGVTLTVNGAFLDATAWPSSTVTDTLWVTTWTPGSEGRYTLLASASDWAGLTQTSTQPVSVTVDVWPPYITTDARVLSTTHRVSWGRVALTGVATDSVGLEAVQVSIDGGAWDDAAFDGAAWRYLWYLGGEPDGAAYTVTARARDAANRITQATTPMTVDLGLPAPMTVTLAYTNSLGAYTVLAPGQTVRDVLTPALLITWTASSDGSGLGVYLAGWTTSPTSTTGLGSHPPAAGRYHEQIVGEAQKRYAQVIAQDIYGNWQWQTLGPIYADAPTTPDYIADLDYHGWMESQGSPSGDGCSQIGMDREVARMAPSRASLADVQKLYMSWDDISVRLTWVGADWNKDGDLFIYLDTKSGGTTSVYDPYGTGPVISLPAQDGRQLAADYAIWVKDAGTARLLTWSGSTWSSQPIDSDHFKLNTGLRPPHTDLLIPRAWLDSPTTLKLVALASEDDALRIWAAMPDKNPLNSTRVVNPVAFKYIGQDFALTQQYEWSSLGPNQCPNLGQFSGGDLRVALTTDPYGVELGFQEYDLPGLLTPGRYLDNDPMDGVLDIDLPVDVQPTLVGQGSVITYTLTYTNEGASVAPGARVTLTVRGGVDLANSSPVVINLGDVAAGVSGTLYITTSVNPALNGKSAEVDGVVADATHGAFDWLWVQHDIDTDPPTGLTIDAPAQYANAYTNTVVGAVNDPSGVPVVNLEALSVPAGSVVASIACPDSMPYDSQWNCLWNAGGAADGTQFDLRAQAMDRFGNTSAWTSLHRVTVDATPPTIVLSTTAEAALGDGLLTAAELGLSGQVLDDRQASDALVCAARPGGPEQNCALIAVKPGTTPTGDWYGPAPIVGSGDGSEQTLSFYGLDSVGNRSVTPLTRTVTVDVVAPVITVTTALQGVVQATWNTVLAGEVSDGRLMKSVRMHIARPDGNVVWDTPVIVTNGNTWTFDYTARLDMVGNYALGIMAEDDAGNQRSIGPYLVTVYESANVANLTMVSQAPSSDPAITGRPLTYTFIISNAGPATAVTTTLAITLPTVVSVAWTSHTCPGSSGVLVCDLGNVSKDAAVAVNIQVDVPLTTTGILVAIARVDSSKVDLDLTDNQLEPLETPTVQPITGLAAESDSPTIVGQITALTATIATGTGVFFSWDLGDGAIAVGSVVTHVYPAAGVYTAIVTASNVVNTLTATTRITTDVPIGTPLLNEGFEGGFPPWGWMRTGRLEDQWWRRNAGQAHGGSNSAFYDDFSGTQDSWLVTPRVTPTLESELVFWQYEHYTLHYQRHSLWVSTGSCDPKDGDFGLLQELGPGAEQTWEQVRVNLDAYAGQPICLAFRYEGDFADEWRIDDVQVTANLVLSNDGPTPLGHTTTMTASVATGTNIVYEWDLGDGQPGTGSVVTHTYPAMGYYTVVVTASNSVSMITDTMLVPIQMRVFMPVVMLNHVTAPDLVVERLVVTSTNVQVVVKNQGNAPVVNEFWVDLYVNPSPAPTGVNQTWNMLGSQGLAWGITSSALPLLPGETLTLTVGGAYYVPGSSYVSWPIPAGTPVYAQVDSLDWSTAYGAVWESHEMTGAAYNNITATTSVTFTFILASPKAVEPQTSGENLPLRP